MIDYLLLLAALILVFYTCSNKLMASVIAYGVFLGLGIVKFTALALY